MAVYCAAALTGIVLGVAILTIAAAVCSECCDHDWIGLVE